MYVNDIINLINRKLADEMLEYEDFEMHIDTAIDAINAALSSKFPTLSELRQTTGMVPELYECFPDRYIRTVVVPGAAYNYYTTDEEGLGTAQAYQQEHLVGLFNMTRDYIDSVPEEYADANQGSIKVSESFGYTGTAGGFEVDGSVWLV